MSKNWGDERKGMCNATVVCLKGGLCYVEQGGREVVCSVRGKMRKSETGLLVGDVVELVHTGCGDVVERVYARRNRLLRPPVANVDQVVVVMAVREPEPNLGLVDRILVLAESEGITPLICLSKSDLGSPEPVARVYQHAGYPVVETSAISGLGIDRLRLGLAGKVSVFAGASGVGKSALLNAVLPGAGLAVGEISPKIHRGRHTTREVRLLPLAGGGYVADTPGFSTLEVTSLDASRVAQGFPEFRAFEGRCRFIGCLHDAEPDCEVKAAVESGHIAMSRYANYLKFLAEVRKAEKRQFS